ncbi:hypothetical protein AABB24_015674 [Solanum stoloniferum]|uniref:Uncharacterized protein n=1 Tax=Solanum stoloniferum TaxID=62892 RepID=A0ABD2TQM9_9SOLN
MFIRYKHLNEIQFTQKNTEMLPAEKEALLLQMRTRDLDSRRCLLQVCSFNNSVNSISSTSNSSFLQNSTLRISFMLRQQKASKLNLWSLHTNMSLSAYVIYTHTCSAICNLESGTVICNLQSGIRNCNMQSGTQKICSLQSGTAGIWNFLPLL